MAHIQQQEFCRSIQNKFPDFFKNKFVLDIGSLDINGNNQEYFENCNYLGVDIAPGRNVDIVSKGHELGFPDSTFDIIISTECFEHDQFYDKTIKNLYRMLKFGGLFIFTCATSGRPEHGTRRTTPEDAPLLQSDIEWSDYYKNLTENDIREILEIESNFSSFEFCINEISHDLYFFGFKKGNFEHRDDYSFLLHNKPRQLYSFIQLFIENENGISEETSLKLPVSQNSEAQTFEFDLSGRQGIKNLRLDPLNECCVVEIESLHVKKENETIDLLPHVYSNADIHHGTAYFFTTEDPIIYFEGLHVDSFKEAQKLTATIRFAHMGKDALHVSVKQTKTELDQTKTELDQTKTELIGVYMSKSWKITRPLRAMMRIFRR